MPRLHSSSTQLRFVRRLESFAGFYQLMKVLTTPIIVLIDRVWHKKRVTAANAILLTLACFGIAVATVSDVQLNLRGSLLALASICAGIVQKVFNEHMQQRGGLSTLQLMHAAFPWMTIIGLLLVPVMDPPAVLSLSVALSPELLTSLAWSSFAAVCINFSTTLVLGVTSALTLVLLGQLKSCGALLAGALLFDATPNAKATAGAATAVSCICLYTLLKLHDQRHADTLAVSEPLLERR